MTAVLMVLTSHDSLGTTGRSTGWFLSEAAHPWKLFFDAGWTMSWVSPLGGNPAMDGADLKDPVQAEFLKVFGSKGPHTMTPNDVDPSEFDAIFYVGGHGAMWDFPNNTELAKIATSIYEGGGVVAAVCHGPAGLINIKLTDGSYLVNGKNVAGFTNDEETAVGLADVVPFLLANKLTERNAIHRPRAPFEANVIADGRLITGQNPASATGVAKAVYDAITPGS
jgi:putative intracellular protease/amidase